MVAMIKLKKKEKLNIFSLPFLHSEVRNTDLLLEAVLQLTDGSFEQDGLSV